MAPPTDTNATSLRQKLCALLLLTDKRYKCRNANSIEEMCSLYGPCADIMKKVNLLIVYQTFPGDINTGPETRMTILLP
jgi:hypothetical protein